MGNFLLGTGLPSTKEVDVPPPLPPSLPPLFLPLPTLCPSLLGSTVSYRRAGYFGNCYSYKPEWFGCLRKDEGAEEMKRFADSLEPLSPVCASSCAIGSVVCKRPRGHLLPHACGTPVLTFPCGTQQPFTEAVIN